MDNREKNMTSMWQTIQQYKHSCSALRKRIDELNTQISGHTQPQNNEIPNNLQQRRYLLYTELYEMETAIHEMQQYLSPGLQKDFAG